MPTPLRVLIAEDRPADAELMVYELNRSGFEPKWTRVETEEEYLKELQTAPDVILADHTLPEFDSPRALQLLKKTGLDTPLIVVTGSISEEVAVERIKQGASDYILKDRMARLGPAVKRALEEKKLRDEKRKAEELTHRNLERIRALHEINVAITSTLDLRTVLNLLLEKIDALFTYPVVTTVRLFNKERGLLEPIACRNLDENEWRAERLGPGYGPAKTAFETKSPVFLQNVQADPQTRDTKFARKHGLVSRLVVPMIAKDERLGILSFYTKEEHEFTNEETEFFMTLGEQAAIAIHNAQLYDEMVRSNKVKDEFLSVTSHELRTPLNVVMGFAVMMQDKMLGEINQKQDEACQKIIRHTQDLLSMVNSILYATSLEAKQVKVDRRVMNAGILLDELKSSFEARLEKDVTLVWDYPSNLPDIDTDSQKLRHILQYLIDNAIKFTEKGRVTISSRIRQEAKGKAQPLLEFTVADNGVGIAKEKLPIIFEKFTQVDSSETRAYGGVGLGLYIVKQFTDLLGGKVSVESELGKGSTFTITIPYEVASWKDSGRNTRPQL